ncbi:solute carrier family 25 (mitochondrial 2-oxodicarboxylate transporter), member 21 [Entomortierella parvispora]|uniref:Solute carrier family 25 (Mitochondrial 2-oxodicarboxylate transporter), member 21 n=1 Tax=Entomortierella parvispora TaxID=205924 RepID=A0A9P3HKD6_9FUNG|nr:solute carrier family 25 (mitochondrial 2-oxodicarboxylate transporter), member 21 [Entomortierella parvispora]
MSSQTKTAPTPLPFVYQSLAGAIAGMTELACLYPLDLVKTRFQLQVNPPKSPASTLRSAATATTTAATTSTAASSSNYTSMIDCLRKIVQNEGATGLYRGILPPMLVEAPRRAIKFGANEQWGFALKKLFSLDRFTALQAGFVGSIAGATEAFLVTPFDLLKVRLQNRNSQIYYSGTFDCLRKTISQEGIWTLFHGLEATIWRHATWSGWYFMTINSFRTAFPQRHNTTKNETMLRTFIAGTIGGTLGTLANNPFDVVKSRIQVQGPGVKKYGWALSSIATLYREEGFRALYKGLAPKLARLGPGGGLLLVVFDQVSGMMRRNHFDQEPPTSSFPTAST